MQQEKNKHWGLCQTKKPLQSKENSQQTKLTKQEKIFPSHIFDKELISTITQDQKKKKISKLDRGAKQTFFQTPTDGKRVYEKMLNSTSLIIREM